LSLQRIDPLRAAWPLFRAQASRAIEQQAQATLAPYALMQRAGEAVARLALAVAPHASHIWIAAGPGNNGGDGLEAATRLRAAGKAVSVTLHGDASRLPADAANAFAAACSAGVSISGERPTELGVHDLVIDALLGLGASRAPSGVLAEVISHVNESTCPVLAVDLPSGLNPDTGQALGGSVVRASHTLALLTLKPGLVTGVGRDHAGDLWIDRLGVDGPERPDAWLSGGGPMLTAAMPRRHAHHKGSYGDVHIVGGATGMRGAALLAARAAHAAGAGRVYVTLLDDASMTLDPNRPELMFRPQWWTQPAPEIAAGSVVCGCGGGSAVREVLPALLAHATLLVLDADALNAIATDASLQKQLQARAARDRATVLTPHPLEAARLLSIGATQVQADRLAAAQQLADLYKCVVVLKGSGTVIAGPGVVPHVNSTGNAALASAGTGDVLAGWIGGTWAQAEGTSLASALQVAPASVFRHGLAAERSDEVPLRAANLIDAMMRVQP
jgi:hydroxyethylthiazole kinase-like uncharacterized protein yjeF